MLSVSFSLQKTTTEHSLTSKILEHFRADRFVQGSDLSQALFFLQQLANNPLTKKPTSSRHQTLQPSQRHGCTQLAPRSLLQRQAVLKGKEMSHNIYLGHCGRGCSCRHSSAASSSHSRLCPILPPPCAQALAKFQLGIKGRLAQTSRFFSEI